MRRFSAWSAVTMAVVVAAAAVPARTGPAPVRVEVGSVTVLPVPGLTDSVHVANPGLFNVTPIAANKLVLLGLKTGQSRLLILDGEGQEILNVAVLVTPQDSHTVTLTRGVTEVTLSCSPRCVETEASVAAGSSRAGPSGSNATSAGAAGAGAADAPAGAVANPLQALSGANLPGVLPGGVR